MVDHIDICIRGLSLSFYELACIRKNANFKNGSAGHGMSGSFVSDFLTKESKVGKEDQFIWDLCL